MVNDHPLAQQQKILAASGTALKDSHVNTGELISRSAHGKGVPEHWANHQQQCDFRTVKQLDASIIDCIDVDVSNWHTAPWAAPILYSGGALGAGTCPSVLRPNAGP